MTRLLRSLIRPATRMTPLGNALRTWIPGLIALGVSLLYLYASLPDSVPLLVYLMRPSSDTSLFSLIFYNVWLVLWLMLLWLTLVRAPAEEVQEWALFQEAPTPKPLRRFRNLLGTRGGFSGRSGQITIVTITGIGVFFALTLLPQSDGLRVFLCASGILISWAMLHTSYALYYAHLYYQSASNPGGLQFLNEPRPDALDFAYYSFAVGMTFNGSDVGVDSRRMRRATLVHRGLSFFYNTAILALVFNLVLSGV